jgi:hypothetical protein
MLGIFWHIGVKMILDYVPNPLPRDHSGKYSLCCGVKGLVLVEHLAIVVSEQVFHPVHHAIHHEQHVAIVFICLHFCSVRFLPFRLRPWLAL